ncbi:hypothetical protein [Saccharospirillum salsuginis]|uniref:Uncharacterized protein n=1 Tax=Saccharospirillum salsuginis TaxID=418750 RepID=A0A918K373_9GAMM|nr:hypothetical protein [Saccharospirillum salsuginis]GGX46246.1 hypothetical protein GCM10007392_11640 [Saccharospirillum salsuginis]
MENTPETHEMTLSSPEDGLMIHPDVRAMDPDMLQGILCRSKALLSLLSSYFEAPLEQRGFKVSDQIVSNTLWQLNGNLELIEAVVGRTDSNQPLPQHSDCE